MLKVIFTSTSEPPNTSFESDTAKAARLNFFR